MNHTKSSDLLSAKKIAAMALPLVLEGLLCTTVGFVDTLMVSSLGAGAVSSVSTIDAINILINEVLLAIGTSGTVVISQHLGRQQVAQACDTGKQLIYINLLLGVFLAIIAFCGGDWAIRTLFPTLQTDVYEGACTYLKITCFSYPFLALFHCGASVYRAQGRFKASMLLSLLMNIINAAANALFIFGFGWGVAGAAAGTVVARIVSALVLMYTLQSSQQTIRLTQLFHIRFNHHEIKNILKIGIPCGLENTLFHVGKILLQSVIVVLGTNAIAANALVNNLAGLTTIPANAFCIITLTLVGTCAGAQNYTLAGNYIRKLSVFCEISLLIFNILLFLSADFWVGLYGLSAEISESASALLRLYCGGCIVLWTPSFLFPSALRATGDTRFTMGVSFLSMWIFRIGFAYLFVTKTSLGLTGVWICMLIDWFVRAVIFSLRLHGSHWKKNAVI